VKMRLDTSRPPCSDLLQPESEQTKKLVLKWDELLVKDGLVYRQKARLKDAGHVQPQLLLPRSEVQRAIELCHAGSVGGHFGIEKTLKQVERRFYWVGWKDDVRRYCRSCEQCSRYHRGKLPKHGALQPVLSGAPYERWYIDLTGPHPQSNRGNIWILTCMDSFTKWAEAFPLRSKEAEPIARILVEQRFTCFGPPLSILSDLGCEVDGKIMTEVCKLFGIEKLRTTAYKPSTNQVERFHKTMNSVLAKTVAENQRDWDARLPFAMAAYRAMQHDSTGYSPNMLVLGRETRAPPDIIYGTPMESSEHDYDRFVEQTRDRAIQAFYDVRVSLQKRAQRNKKYYDLGLKGADFQTGDWVLYFNPRKLRGKQMKWVRQYEGPFLIIAKPTKLTARIQRSARAQSQVVHVDKLKKFLGKTPKAWRVPNASAQTEPLLERGTRLPESPCVADGSSAIGVATENSGLPVGAADLSVSMSGVDPFSLTPRALDSSTAPHVEGKHDGVQIVRADVQHELGFNSPNGQVESVVRKSLGSTQLNERSELCSSSERLIVQPELSVVNEQGKGQVDISPPAGEQRGSFVSESRDLAGGEVSSNAPASQMELAVCCRDEDCPLRTVQTAMGTPGRLVTDIEGNDFSCSSYGSDTAIVRSPMSEKSFADDFSILNYPDERVGDDMDDTDDAMTITRSDLYADTVAQRARTQMHFDNPTNFPSQRPSRKVKRPARFNDFQTQFTQSQNVRRIKLSLSSPRSWTECKQTRIKDVTFKRRHRLHARRQQCRVPAVTWGYINRVAHFIAHYESGGDTDYIGASLQRKLIIIQRSKKSKTYSASTSNSLIGVGSSIGSYGVTSRGKITQLVYDSRVMARTKNTNRKGDEQRQNGVTKAVHGYPCPRCDKVFDHKYNLTRHTVHKHYVTPQGNPASEDLRSRFMQVLTNLTPLRMRLRARHLRYVEYIRNVLMTPLAEQIRRVSNARAKRLVLRTQQP